MSSHGLLTEEDRRVELALVIRLAEMGERDLLADHVRVCVRFMGIPVVQIQQMAHNLAAAAGEHQSHLGTNIRTALEGLADDAGGH